MDRLPWSDSRLRQPRHRRSRWHRQAISHLIQAHSHRRIGLVIGEAGDASTDVREQGWRQSLDEAALPAGPIARGSWTRAGGLAAGRELLSAAAPPSAVFASSDLQAIGVLRAAHELGVGVPQDLAVVSFDGTTESEFSWPTLTTMRQPIKEMARAAVEIVLDRQAVPRHHPFEADLILRQSCGCRGSPPPSKPAARQPSPPRPRDLGRGRPCPIRSCVGHSSPGDLGWSRQPAGDCASRVRSTLEAEAEAGTGHSGEDCACQTRTNFPALAT